MARQVTSCTVPHNADPVLLLTRPAAAGERFLAEMGAELAGVDIVKSPVIGIEQLAPALPDIRPEALILTSENGAEAAARLGLAPMRAHVVGPRTAEVARGLGFDPAPPVPDAEALLALLLALRPKGPLLHVRGEHASGAVGPRLNEAGIPVVELVAYAQHALAPSDEALALLAGGRPVVLPLFSPRSAVLVAGWATPHAPVHVAAISAAAAGRSAGIRPSSMTIAETPDGPGMAAATRLALVRAREG